YDEILAVELIQEAKRLDNESEILDIIEKRNKAKKDKDYELADSIRNELLSKGIELIDTREGTTYRIVGE
ncbi:MAG: cysteine--tRNA ligase, partial [Bacilli bacterium]|nr:cysteine--tRNA ligase [Bacilli bacterium]